MIETRYQLLNYKIIGSSSNDPDYPLDNISSNNPKDGWHSARFPSFPVEILVQFQYPVHIRQINLLLHETLISSRIDIYHFFPSKYNDLLNDYNSLTFDKIGYVIPDSNSRSDYQYRELKRIAISDNCTYLKVVFQKNINNIYNPFNQVALINLQCFGFVYNEENLSDIFKDKFHKNTQLIYNNPEEFDNLLKTENFDKYIPIGEMKDNEFHQICSAKLKDLNEHLSRAKYYNDYDKAKTINDFIEQVRIIGYKVEHLEKLKRIAVDKEDYLKAKEIKNEIDKILGFVNEIEQKYYRLPTPPISHNPPEEKLDYIRPSPEPSLNQDIKNYREIGDIPRKKLNIVSQQEKIITNIENKGDEKEKDLEESKKLEIRGFHNIDDKEKTEKENLNDVTFSDEDSIREELRYKLNK